MVAFCPIYLHSVWQTKVKVTMAAHSIESYLNLWSKVAISREGMVVVAQVSMVQSLRMRTSSWRFTWSHIHTILKSYLPDIYPHLIISSIPNHFFCLWLMPGPIPTAPNFSSLLCRALGSMAGTSEYYTFRIPSFYFWILDLVNKLPLLCKYNDIFSSI